MAVTFLHTKEKILVKETTGYKLATLEEIQAFAQEGIFLHYNSIKEAFTV